MATIDNVKVRIRTHDPSHVEEKEVDTSGDAISFLYQYQRFILTTPGAYR
jgi:hypothetical protein